jgi:hypothetical protein
MNDNTGQVRHLDRMDDVEDELYELAQRNYPNRSQRLTVRYARHSGKLRDSLTPTPPSTRPWSWSQMLAYAGGGWLKRGVPDAHTAYNNDMLVLALPDTGRLKVYTEIAATGATHTPFQAQNSKPLPGGLGHQFDLWEDPDSVRDGLTMAVDKGLIPVLFLASDIDAGEIGIRQLVERLAEAWPIWGQQLCGGICPRIEMDESNGRPHDTGVDRAAWAYHARLIREVVGPDVPIWCHFLRDKYYKPDLFDGILYQHDRDNHQPPPELRGPRQHRGELTNRNPYEGTAQDRIYISPLLSAIEQGWTFVSHEFCQRVDDTETDYLEVRAGLEQGFRDVGVAPRVG